MFSPIPIENSGILGISWKSKDFTIGFPIVMKMFLRINFLSARRGNCQTFLIRISISGLFESKSMLWKFMGKCRKFPFSTQKTFYKISYYFCYQKFLGRCNHLSLGAKHTRSVWDSFKRECKTIDNFGKEVSQGGNWQAQGLHLQDFRWCGHQLE